jgi:tetratricopeptide (TPR) repeat protein
VRAALNTALARLFFGLGRLYEELNAAEQAMALGRAGADEAILAVATARQGAVLMALGRRTEARRALEEAVRLAEANGALGTASVAFDNLGEIAREGGRLMESLRYLQQSLDLAEQTGRHSRQGWALTEMGRTEVLLGRWTSARRRFERAAQLIDSGDTTSAVDYIQVHLAELALLRGDWTEAGNRLDRILASANPHRHLCLVRRVQRLLAARDLLERRPQAALDRLRSVLDRPDLEEPQVTRLLPLVAQAECDLGHHQDAETTLAACLRRARAQEHRLAETNALRVLAMLRFRQGLLGEAGSAAAQSISLAASMSAPYLEARARLDYGIIASHASDQKLAHEQFQTALILFQQLGARPLVARTEHALSELENRASQ